MHVVVDRPAGGQHGCGHRSEARPETQGESTIRLADDSACGLDHEVETAYGLTEGQSDRHSPKSQAWEQRRDQANAADRGEKITDCLNLIPVAGSCCGRA